MSFNRQSPQILWPRASLLLTLLLIILIAGSPLSSAALAARPVQTASLPGSSKIDPQLSAQFSTGQPVDFFVWIKGQADLGAATQPDKAARGAYVLNALQTLAESSQAGVIDQLNAAQAAFQPYLIANTVLVRGGSAELAGRLAARPDVSRLSANRSIAMDGGPLPSAGLLPRQAGPQGPQTGVEPNLSFIKADQAWAQGIDGSGVTVAVIDTGLMWNHPAIRAHYRGWNGASADHNFNWWDAAGDASGTRLAAPYDLAGHGTHVAGTIAGSDEAAALSIGVAPGAKVIACRAGNGPFDVSALLTCLEWILAPWDLNHQNPDPAKAPDVLNNSWGGQELGEDDLELAFDKLRAAGIVIVDSAGNEGPDCTTMNAESSIPGIISVGAVDYVQLPFPGRLTGFSSRGPSLRGAAYAPMVTAPGANILSAYNDGKYIAWEGTSMAAPHVAGLAALVLQANPVLKGRPDDVAFLIRQNAAALTDATGVHCGAASPGGPSNDWGHGTIDALATVLAAETYGTHRGTLSGSITFPGAATPPLAAVQLTSGDLIYTTLSDDSGHYQLAVQVGHTYQLAIYASGYATGTGSFTPVDGALSPRSDSLTPIGSSHALSGQVTDRLPGWPVVAFVLYRANTPAYGSELTVSSPGDGTYQILLDDGLAYHVQPIFYNPDYKLYRPGKRTLVAGASANRALNPTVEPDAIYCKAQEYERQIPGGYDFYYFNYLPAGWKNLDLTPSGTGPVWNLAPPVQYADDINITGGLGIYALADNRTNPVVMDTALVTSTISITSLMYLALTFRYALNGGLATVDYSTDPENEQGQYNWQLLDTLFAGSQTFWYEHLGARTAGQTSIRFRFRYQGSQAGFMALDDIAITSCRARSGGFMYGTISDANTGLPVGGATIYSNTAYRTTTRSLFGSQIAGMYRLFVPLSGSSTIYPGVYNTPYYEPASTSVYLSPGESVLANFSLKASRFNVQTGDSIQLNLPQGATQAVDVTITNTGQLAGVVRALPSSAGVGALLSPDLGWISENDYPIALADASLTYLDGIYYAFGGQNGNTVYAKGYRYDPADSTWQPLTDLPAPRAFHTAIAYQGKIYLFGGWDDTHTLLTRVDVYNPANDSWSSAKELAYPPYLGQGIAALDGMIYLLGGADRHPDGLGGYFYGPVNVLYQYDPQNDSWAQKENLFTNTGFWGCLARTSSIFCAGGLQSSQPNWAGNPANYLFKLDLAQNSAMYKQNMRARHAQATSATALGRLYMTGGILSPAVGILVESSAGEYYEPELDRWVQIPGLGDIRGAAGACGLMAIGGQDSAGVYYNKTWHLPGEGFCQPPAVSWLSVESPAISLDPGASGTFHLVVNAANLSNGPHTAHLTIATDSPYGAIDLLVTLTVGTPAPKKIYLPVLKK